MSVYEWLSLVVSTLGLGGIAVSIWYSARQTQATVFADFSERYAEIDQRNPNTSGYYRKAELVDEEKRCYFRYLEQYLDLLHQEYELHRRHMIDSGIWGIWVEYARAHVRGHHFKEFWETDSGKPAFKPNPSFVGFLEDLMK